jgi:cytochrome c oxidase assembly factor CtaG
VDALRWNLHPDGLLVIGLLAGAYGIGVRSEGVSRWRLASFGGGLVLILAAHVTPLASLANTSLLSAHLLQNVMLAEWAPALIVLGVPTGLAARLGRLRAARFLTHPAVALPLWLATYVAWHVPAAYDAALHHQSTVLHLEHACYFVAGLLLVAGVQAMPHRLVGSRPPTQARRSCSQPRHRPFRCSAADLRVLRRRAGRGALRS